jgi:iron complex transport system substrate-binding protein
VDIPEDPQRVVSFAPSITECLYVLGVQDTLVGATQYSNYPPEARRLPRVGSYISLDLERIVGLNPDLCLATKDGNPIQVIERLEELGLPVFAVDPRDLSQVMATIRSLGRIMGADKQAESAVEAMQRRVEQVRDTVSGVTHRPRVFYQIGTSPIVSAGTRTFIHELIQLAGGVNLAAGDTPYPRYSREDILSMQPEVIIISSMTGSEDIVQQVGGGWQAYEQIPAVAEERIYTVESDLFNRASPRLVKGLEILAACLHPDLFPSEQ